jgi:transcriptional regulator with XRE-family HTH domain
MDIMDTARLNIKRRREIKGLRQQDMADKLCMSLRSYQSLENGETKLDIERLERIAGILEASMEELLKQEGIVINQEIRETATGSGTGDIYLNIDKDLVNKLLDAKNEEINQLTEENKYLRDKIDQFMELIRKKE